MIKLGQREWVSQKEMEKFCPSCAENMKNKGITKIKASILMDMIRGKMICLS